MRMKAFMFDLSEDRSREKVRRGLWSDSEPAFVSE
jgi:hypothetical protein